MNKLLATTLLGLVAATTVSNVQAMDAPKGKVKCYGIAKAGKNDCSSANGSHSCAGSAKIDNDPNEWVALSNSEDCTTAGGKTEAPKAN